MAKLIYLLKTLNGATGRGRKHEYLLYNMKLEYWKLIISLYTNNYSSLLFY